MAMSLTDCHSSLDTVFVKKALFLWTWLFQTSNLQPFGKINWLTYHLAFGTENRIDYKVDM